MKCLAAALGLFCVLAAPRAHAATIAPSGGSFTIDFKGTDDNVNSGPFLDWLTSTMTFTVQAWSGDTVVVDVALANTTDAGAGYGSVITSFGFDIDPDVLGTSTVSGLYDGLKFSERINAHGLSAYIGGVPDLCVTDNANCTGGNPNNGLAAAQSGAVQLTLRFASTPAALTLDSFFVRYQALTFNGQTFGSGSGAGIPCTGLDDEDCDDVPPPCEGDTCPPPDTVPEPTTLALLGFGFLGAGVAARRAR